MHAKACGPSCRLKPADHAGRSTCSKRRDDYNRRLMSQEKTDFRELIHEAEELEEEFVPPEPAAPDFPEIASGKIFLFLITFYTIAIGFRVLAMEGPSFFALLKAFIKPGAEVPNSPSILLDYFL